MSMDSSKLGGMHCTSLRCSLVVEGQAKLIRELRAQLAARDAALGDAWLLLTRIATSTPTYHVQLHEDDLWRSAQDGARAWLAAHPHKGDPDGD